MHLQHQSTVGNGDADAAPASPAGSVASSAFWANPTVDTAPAGSLPGTSTAVVPTLEENVKKAVLEKGGPANYVRTMLDTVETKRWSMCEYIHDEMLISFQR